MQLLVMSQNEIEDYNMQENKYGSIVISISDIGGMEPFITPSERNKILKVLSLKFNDTEKEDGISGCIEDKHVEAIYNFILDYLDRVEMLIVQCVKGESRSAGVAKALKEIFEIEDNEIEPEYIKYGLHVGFKIHNNLVYKKVLERFNRELDED